MNFPLSPWFHLQNANLNILKSKKYTNPSQLQNLTRSKNKFKFKNTKKTPWKGKNSENKDLKKISKELMPSKTFTNLIPASLNSKNTRNKKNKTLKKSKPTLSKIPNAKSLNRQVNSQKILLPQMKTLTAW